MASVQISREVILVEIARGLGYLVVGCDVRSMSGGKYIASVSYRPINNNRSEPSQNNLSYGTPEDTAEKAKEAAAENALRMLKKDFSVDIDDINYHEKFVLQSENYDLELKLEESRKTIGALNHLVSQLKSGWSSTIDHLKGLAMYVDGEGSEPSDGGMGEGSGIENGVGLYEEMGSRIKAVHNSSSKALEEALN